MIVEYLDWNELTEAETLQLKLNRLERDAEHLDKDSIEFKELITTFRRIEQQLNEFTSKTYV